MQNFFGHEWFQIYFNYPKSLMRFINFMIQVLNFLAPSQPRFRYKTSLISKQLDTYFFNVIFAHVITMRLFTLNMLTDAIRYTWNWIKLYLIPKSTIMIMFTFVWIISDYNHLIMIPGINIIWCSRECCHKAGSWHSKIKTFLIWCNVQQ